MFICIFCSNGHDIIWTAAQCFSPTGVGIELYIIEQADKITSNKTCEVYQVSKIADERKPKRLTNNCGEVDIYETKTKKQTQTML